MRDPDWLVSQDEEMAVAMRAARASFWEFARNVELDRWRIVPAIQFALIKAYFPDPQTGMHGEFHFVDDIMITKSGVVGTLNAPGRETHDTQVRVPFDQICDWFLVLGESIHPGGIGGFTVDILKKEIPLSERQEYESHPPVSWYRHREGLSAQDELDQVPSCRQCGRRELIEFSYRGGKCGCCANGLERVKCEQCGIPLIRSSEQPKLCFLCNQLAPGGPTSSPRPTDVRGMSRFEKLYMVGVYVVLTLVTIVLGFMIFDPAGGQAQGRFLMLALTGVVWVILAATTAVNIKQHRLMTISTVLQILALLSTCIGVPLAVFGIVLLLNRRSPQVGQ